MGDGLFQKIAGQRIQWKMMAARAGFTRGGLLTVSDSLRQLAYVGPFLNITFAFYLFYSRQLMFIICIKPAR